TITPAGHHVAPEILEAHNAWIKGSKEIAGLMLMTMEPDIQQNLEPLHAHEMLRELKTLFAQQAEKEEGQSVSSYVLKMKGYIDNLERLGHPVTLGLGVSQILIGLRKEYDGFVQNYNMHSMGKTVNEGQNHGKVKNKQAYAPKHKIPPPPKRENPTKDSIYHECGEIGHWKRNYPQYLAELLKKKKNAALGAGGSDTSLNHEEDDLEIDEPQSDIIPIRRSTRTRHAPDRMCLYINAEERELGDLDNKVWVLVELPPNGKTIGSMWLFKKKTDMDGNVHIYKARLVAKGYTQTLGINYEETFSPVVDIGAIRVLIAIAAYYDYEIWQMDVKTAFLNGYLNEEVYMEQPEGFLIQNIQTMYAS
nr:zinc finger, CCHC-type [Tanacetum cinerariifolium]